MRILVTGGGGFLGSVICEQLAARGDEVIAYQRSAADHLVPLGVYSVRGDLGNLEQLLRDSRGCDAIIHTASKAGMWGTYNSYYDANVTGTDHVITVCRENNIRNLVYTSSPSVVHGGGDIEGGDETLPYPGKFHAPYPATKALAEQMVMAANNEHLRTVGLRPHLIWGPGDPHLLPRMMDKAAGKYLFLPGTEKLIDTVYVDNAAQAHLLALDNISEGGSACGKTYFISNDEPLPQREIIAGMLDAAGMQPEIRPIAPWIAKTAGLILQSIWKLFRLDSEPPLSKWSAEQLSTAHWYDISAAKNDLSYVPRFSIKKGLGLLKKHFEEIESK
jgi:nucleoside-diphosphate-sugar epimerase